MSSVQHVFQFTTHAVHRFIERVRQGSSGSEALRALHDAAHTARFVGYAQRTGDAIWRVDGPPMRWITKHEDRIEVVVTVLDGVDGGEDEAIDDVRAAFERAQRGGLDDVPRVSTPPSKLIDQGKAFWQWQQVEQNRIAGWREQIKAQRRAEEARIEAERGARTALLREAADRLHEVDPACSAALIRRIDDATGRTHVLRLPATGS